MLPGDIYDVACVPAPYAGKGPSSPIGCSPGKNAQFH